VKYADDFVLHAAEKNSNTKHGWQTKWNWNMIWNGKNVEEKHRIWESRGNHPYHRLWYKKQLYNVEYFNYLCSVTVNKWCKTYTHNKIQECYGKINIQQEEGFLHHEIKLMEETGQVLHLEHRAV
jgi:hypothetical protein